MTRRWFAVDVDVDVSACEAVEYAFNSLDALGTEIDHLRRSADGTKRVTGYFNEPPEQTAIDAEIAHAFAIHGIDSTVSQTSLREVENRDWLAEWKRHWKPTEVGKFVVAPPWSDVESDKIVIRIEPNMAFGTGTHNTTQLCLKTIGERYSPEMSFLDVGTGTGILAIGAAKLGATDIFACDTDGEAIKIARENASLNGVAEFIEFADEPIDEQTSQYDFVCANLTVDVIVPILNLLLDKSKKLLLLSGILTEQRQIIQDELLKLHISNIKIETSGEWISVLIER